MASEHSPQRAIRSFVRRDSRLTRGQKHAIEQHWDKYGIDFSDSKLNLKQIFQRTASKVLDIGCGMGDSTITMATQNPDKDYLAVEVHKPGVGSLIRKAVAAELNNIRIISHDIIDVLHQQLNSASFDEIYIYFPDPWPKKRHHKRRLINPEFLNYLKPVLKQHGRLFIATDWQDYADQILTVCDSDHDLLNLAGKGSSAPRPHWRPVTKFESRGEKLQHGVWDFVYALK